MCLSFSVYVWHYDSKSLLICICLQESITYKFIPMLPKLLMTEFIIL